MKNKIIAIYPGRFQPFGKHHAAAFAWLQKQFGEDNSYIVTSNVTNPIDSPFNFAEKKAIIEQYGIKPDHIIEVKNPYNPVELYNKFDKENTSAVIMVGDKDMSTDPRIKVGTKKDGSPSFFQNYEGNENALQPLSKHGYLITGPHISLKVPGNENNKEMSGTEIRDVLGDTKISKEKRKELFYEIFGWYSEKMANYIFDKLENKMAEKFSKDWWLNVLLQEGGNVFGTTSPIAKADIEPTLEVFVSRLSKLFPAKASTFKQFEKLGSVGKKELSGDIDLAYDVKNFFPDGKTPDFKGWGIDEDKYNELVAGFTKRARNASPEKIKLRAVIELIAEKINNAYDDIDVDPKGSGSGALFCSIQQYDSKKKPLPKYVQTDVNIGNLDWLTFSYYSNTYSGNVKGLHRTQLMLSLFANKNYTFGHGSGVVDKATGEQVARNSQEAIDLLNNIYGFNLDRDILNDYFKLEEYLKANLSKEEYNAIIDRYLKILDSTRADIPENLQDYWIANQQRLGLKGKFLPDNSNLISYQTLTESGSAGGNRISRSFVEKTKEDYIKRVLSKFPGFKDARVSGSYNTSSKEDFGDIDLVVVIEGDDKKKIKQELAAFLSSLPDDVIVPFKSVKYAGKKTLNTGEIVTILYPILGLPNEYIQIDNIIAISEEESNFKKAFLDYPAETQGLLLGLAKTILLEEDPQEVFKKLGIQDVPELGPNEEYEFNLSSAALTLRIVKLSSDFKEIERKEVWKTTQWNTIKRLFSNFDVDGSFEDLLYDIVRKVKNPRSRNRIKGIFKSMVSIKSGEVGTAKGNNKQRALDKVDHVL